MSWRTDWKGIKAASLKDWLCFLGLHNWLYVVVDGCSFRKCKHCDKFKDEGNE